MNSLHSIPHEIPKETLFWSFQGKGHIYRENDADRYPYAPAHRTCANSFFREKGITIGTTTVCYCGLCYSNTQAHFFIAFGLEKCESCIAGRHPKPPNGF